MCILVSILLDIEYDHENEGGDDRCDGGKMRESVEVIVKMILITLAGKD